MAVVIALATACLGGIFTSTPTDIGVKVSLFGVRLQLNRLNCAAGHSRPLWTSATHSETEVVYLGKSIDVLPKVKEIANDLSSKGLQHVVLLPRIKTGLEATQGIVESFFLGSVIYNIVILGIP